MVQVLGRSPSTISRELRSNAQPAGYASTPARALQRRRQSRPPNKLHRDGILFGLMRHFLGQRWSLEQIALTLARFFPKVHEHRVSH
jgi:IS30 family transposase